MKKYFHAFNLINGKIGPQRFTRLLQYFKNDLSIAWSSSDQELTNAGIERKIIQIINQFRSKIDPDIEYKKLIKQGVSVLTILDQNYPSLLKEISNSPPILYVRGEIKTEDNFALAIVGSRHCSPYGRSVVQTLVRQLVQNNLTIISGLAYGIDTLAHQIAIENSGRTIAVLGSGIADQDIRQIDHQIVKKIINGQGAIISEYPPGSPPLSYHFPYRNRIISGLSQGVLVIEAAQKSGSLITANLAIEQNREVFAIPGSIFSPNSEGTNYLIKNSSAKLIENVNDILNELNISNIPQKIYARQKIKISSNEEQVLSVITAEPIHLDEIIIKSKMGSDQVLALLTILELKGIIKNIEDDLYIKQK
ncbi:MAG TPA: DNA-protecting protein DprA [Candidatus Portnoybacteria bacterium]|nr:DNA-protecting protein DprA [Candidatus Portnoybacteria bacterium]